jgi:hypothetical protein
MLMIKNIDLSTSTSVQILKNSTLLGKILTKRMRQILYGRVSMKNLNGSVILFVNHCSKSLRVNKQLSLRLKEIDPSEMREVINEDHIITMPPFEMKGEGPTHQSE